MNLLLACIVLPVTYAASLWPREPEVLSSGWSFLVYLSFSAVAVALSPFVVVLVRITEWWTAGRDMNPRIAVTLVSALVFFLVAGVAYVDLLVGLTAAVGGALYGLLYRVTPLSERDRLGENPSGTAA